MHLMDSLARTTTPNASCPQHQTLCRGNALSLSPLTLIWKLFSTRLMSRGKGATLFSITTRHIPVWARMMGAKVRLVHALSPESPKSVVTREEGSTRETPLWYHVTTVVLFGQLTKPTPNSTLRLPMTVAVSGMERISGITERA